MIRCNVARSHAERVRGPTPLPLVVSSETSACARNNTELQNDACRCQAGASFDFVRLLTPRAPAARQFNGANRIRGSATFIDCRFTNISAALVRSARASGPSCTPALTRAPLPSPARIRTSVDGSCVCCLPGSTTARCGFRAARRSSVASSRTAALWGRCETRLPYPHCCTPTAAPLLPFLPPLCHQPLLRRCFALAHPSLPSRADATLPHPRPQRTTA